MDPGVLQQVALLAPIVIAASTFAALVWGIWTYKRNGEAQVQLLALGTLQHYLDLAVAHPDLASRGENQPIDAQYAWFAAHALSTAQTLQTLVGHKVDWQRSINSIVREHRSYLRSGAFICDDFSPEFVGYLRERVEGVRCAESGDGK